MTKFDVQHHHSLTQGRRFKFQAVKEYLDSFPSTVPIGALRRTICHQFNLTQKQFYYLFSKQRSKPSLPIDLIRQLQEEGYDVFTSEEPRAAHEPPEILIITNKRMQDEYRSWGDTVTFDLTYNLVKTEHSSGQRWKIGCFVALNSARRIVPVAIVATLHTTRQVYIQIFRTLFRMFEKPPSVLATDEEKAILSAMEQLQHTREFTGLHLLDPYHIIHNIRKRLANKEDIVLFSRMVHARNRAELEALSRQARRRLSPRELGTLDRFIERSQLYCFAAIEPRFFGFSASTSPNQCLHSVLKRIQPQQKHYSIAIRNVIQCCKELIIKSHQAVIELAPIEQAFHMPELKAIRMTVSKPVMNRITEELALSMRLDVLESQGERMLIREYGEVFEVSWRRQGMEEGGAEKWKCSCGYEEKSLLPCRHQLRAILSKKQSMFPYLPQRWKLQEEPSDKNFTRSKGREKTPVDIIAFDFIYYNLSIQV